jgi:tetratricopeptide (TPR) repeat protein
MAYLRGMTPDLSELLPYRLDPDEPPRAGGMGEVYFGHHPGTGLPVAVKRLPAALAANAEARAAFVREVRHTARLCHPNVVALDDFGVATPPGAPPWPWLAMARAESALDRLAPVRDWATLRHGLTAILKGLAHAHALGLVHLDLKPSNVLVFSTDGGRPRLALADFGIARLYGDPREGVVSGAGTPHYMAPEQFSVAHGAIGPAADLYAVGCLTHALVTGRPPFLGRDPAALAAAHLTTPPPSLPTMGVFPPGLAAWTARLLSKRPEERPAFAADALAALESLTASLDLAVGGAGASGELTAEAADAALAATLAPAFTDVTAGGDARDAPPVTAPVSGTPAPSAKTPAAATPHVLTVPAVDPEREGWRPWSPGPGLFPLRRLPLVGRRVERERLWSALLAVAATRRPRVVVLTGPPGVGKTALLDGLAERAHETGAAVVFAGRGGGRGDLLAGLLARAVGAVPGEAASAVVTRCRRAFDLAGGAPPEPADLAACIELVGQETFAAGRSSTMLPTLDARFSALRRLFGHLAGPRVGLLLIDDAFAAPAAVGFAERLLAPDLDAPLLCVLVSRGRGAETEHEPGLLEGLQARPGVETLEVGPLGAAETTHFVRALLGLEPALAAQVEARCEGLPQAAVDLVSAWVASGALRRGRHGATLVSAPAGVEALHEPAAPSDGSGAALAARARAVAGPAGGTMLAVAACLDVPFTLAEWAACMGAAAPAVVESAGLAEALVAAGVWGVEDGPPERFRFARAGVAAAVRASLPPERRAALHADIADGLGEALGAAVLGHHLLAAGRPEAAVEPLLAGLRAALELADTRTAATVLSPLRTALRHVAPGETAHAVADLLEARLARARGALPAARGLVEGVVSGSRTDDAVAAEAWLEFGRIAWNMGDTVGARAALERAWALARSSGRPRLAADARRVHGLVLLHGGDRAGAEGHFEAARTAYRTLDEPVWAATCTMNIGVAARQGGELARARAAVTEALSGHAAAGARWGVAECENELGELSRAEGRWDEAAQHYGRALAINDALGSGDAVFNELNLALVRLEAGDHRAARLALARGQAVLEAQGRFAYAAAVRVLGLAAEALDTPDAGLIPRVAEAARDLAAAGLVDPDLARWSGRAGEHARAAGLPALADAFDGIHFAQRRAL